MTRHELKELDHDPFAEKVTAAWKFTTTHRALVIRWGGIALGVLALIGAVWGFFAWQRSVRQREFHAILDVMEAQVGDQSAAAFGKTYATEDDRRKALLKALNEFIAKYGSSDEGQTARYQLGALKAESGDINGAEAELKAVSGSSAPAAALAKLGIARIYAATGRLNQAESVLRDLADHPTTLVSKEQAELLRAELEAKSNPEDARKTLRALDVPTARAPVSKAAQSELAQVGK